jgi:hypothetical protein
LMPLLMMRPETASFPTSRHRILLLMDSLIQLDS